MYDPFERRSRTPWRDTMQVCMNGHVINSSVRKYPEYNQDYCEKCGEKTITNCPNCNKPIPGNMQDTGVVGFGGTAPEHCQHCGQPFPWIDKIREEKRKTAGEKPIESLHKIFSKFHSIVRQLRRRHDARETLDVTDEYDVQDLLYSLLVLFFDDIRVEEWTPSYAGKSARMDFLLKNEKIVIEVKMTRKGLSDKEIGDQLLVDIERYKEHKDCDTLACFIYDPGGRITNPKGLSNDLSSQSKDNLEVIVIINPV